MNETQLSRQNNLSIKESHDELVQKDIEASKKAIFDLMEHNEMQDEDGYPTDAALDVIKLWHWSDPKGWFDFIKSLWSYSDWGWKEGVEPSEFTEGMKVYRYNISTAGWSGNESIIHAMQKSGMMWFLTWVQSRRGGHYIFELRNFEDDK